MNDLPAFMKEAEMIFTDSPWNTGNLRAFYTKAEIVPEYKINFEIFTKRLFDCIKEINPMVCYTEIGKEFLAGYVTEMRKLYTYVTFFNSTYYHKPSNLCYVVRGAKKHCRALHLDGTDEEDIIKFVCKNEDVSCIGDLCMGRGLTALAAYKNGKKFVGTELNHKRLSVALERLVTAGAKYSIFLNE